MRLGDWDAYQEESGVAAARGDPTALLMSEHNWLRTVLASVEKVLRIDAETALASLESNLQKVKAFMYVHIRKEEDIYFPALESQLAAEGLAVDLQSLYAEHDAVQEWQDRFLHTLISAKGVLPAFYSFHNALVRHFNNEEELVFERAPAMLTPEAGREMVEKMIRLEKENAADVS